MKHRTRHCIVTPDFIGPIKNGGIGTACYELARYLRSECDADVAVLFTGNVMFGSSEQWTSHYQNEHGCRFLTMDDLKPLPEIPHNHCRWFLARSLQIHEWLREQEFTHIHFQDWHANGFVPVQAKKAGLAYEDTVLTCTVHSPQEWIEEGNLMFPPKGVDSILQRHCEKYAASHADVSLFPSRHMLDYVGKKNWGVENPVVVPYLFNRHQTEHIGKSTHVTELCFFGRLETRKGLEVFIGALERLIASRGSSFLPRITFVGKHGTVKSGGSLQFLERFQKCNSVEITICSDLDAAGAQAYLAADAGRVAVVPSLLDNLPYVVIECLQNNIPIIASKIGGIPELIRSEEHLFEPTAKSLADRLERIIENGCLPVLSAYDLRNAEQWWTTMASTRPSADKRSAPVDPSQITVCVAYYNYGKYLPDLLDSLVRQTVGGFCVVVVNDGSTDPHSNKVFAEMKKKYANRTNWKFINQKNGGIGMARNRAVEAASTGYIVFMDADNLAKPQMIERMAIAIGKTKADCLTCYMEGFADGEGMEDLQVVYRYIPTGNCPEAGCFENIFGDANCIISKEAFLSAGGFSLDRHTSYEDWELLARLALLGRKLDVIPEFLHLYRHTDAGFSRSTSVFANHRRVLNAYSDQLPGWGKAMLEGVYANVVPSINGRSEKRPKADSLDASRSQPYRNSTLPDRIGRVFGGNFDDLAYIKCHYRVLGTFWASHPKLHYLLFGFWCPNDSTKNFQPI